MEKDISFGGVGSSVAAILVVIVIAAIFGALGLDYAMTGNLTFWSGLGALGFFLCLAVLLFYPTIVAYDVSGRIDEIEQLRESEGLYKDVVISHPYVWIIFIINLFFSATLIGWFIAFFWAHAPGTVLIPDLIAKKINNLNNQSDNNIEKSNLEKNDYKTTEKSDLQSKLEEVEILLKKGLLTKEEASIRRNKLITDD